MIASGRRRTARGGGGGLRVGDRELGGVGGLRVAAGAAAGGLCQENRVVKFVKSLIDCIKRRLRG